MRGVELHSMDGTIANVGSVNGELGVFYWEPESYNGWNHYQLGAFDSTGRLQVFNTDGTKIQKQAVSQDQTVALQLSKGIYLLRWMGN